MTRIEKAYDECLESIDRLEAGINRIAANLAAASQVALTDEISFRTHMQIALRASGDLTRAWLDTRTEIETSRNLAAVEGASGAKPERHSHNDPAVRLGVWQKTSGKCTYCDTALAKPGTTIESIASDEAFMCVDHFVPQVHGGPDHIDNYVPSCRPCNSRKAARDPIVFVRSLAKGDDR